MRVAEITYSTLANKCPRCHSGKVFVSDNPYKLSGGLKMNESCSSCNLVYEKEPGFFFGAMYVSYALMAAIFITWFVSDLLWWHMSPAALSGYAIGTMLVLFPLVFRWSRIIWINFFVKYEKGAQKKTNIHAKHDRILKYKTQ
ncbi:MAG: DUF983 domain-containing protein [Bacteroidia bacterium]